jgi:methylenetetrahydrofolate reductase (NADPH)
MRTESSLEYLLKQGKFVITAELEPPMSANKDAILKKVSHFKGYVDAINVTDCASAIVRMSSLAVSKLLIDEGLEPIYQLTCRDRNRIAIQSDVLGAYALGVKNILCLTGDHQCLGNHPSAKGVFDLDSVNLIKLMRLMRDEKKFFNGEEMKVSPNLYIGGVFNPHCDPVEFVVQRMVKKVEAGVEFFQSQIIFDVERFKEFMKVVRDSGIDKKAYILAGILPVKSVKALAYMKESVSGMIIPDEFIKRMEKATEPVEEGLRITKELIEQIRNVPGVYGIHISPVKWESIIPRLIEECGFLPRPIAEIKQEVVYNKS